MKKRIKNQLKELRIQKGWTQAELAKLSGVSRQTIISIEKGHYIPSLPLALTFSKIFNIPVEQIFSLKE